MSVSLMIDWPDGTVDEIPIATYKGAVEVWHPLAFQLGLKLVAQFYTATPVEPGNVEEMIREMQTFRVAVAQKGPEWTGVAEVADQLLSAFGRLKASEGWTASIG